MMNEKVYQTVFNTIAPLLPEDWDKLVVYLEYGEDSYSFSFFYSDGKKYVKCFDIPTISEETLFSAFKKKIRLWRMKEIRLRVNCGAI